MAGRIRTIKPELLEDDVTAELSNAAWRLFVSMLVLADDYGNLRCNHVRLRGAVFWGTPDDVDTAAAIVELETAGLITRYDVEAQTYAHINGWAKHQRVDKPGKPRVPSMDGTCPSADTCDTEGFTYIARKGTNGPIKIGFSKNPARRAIELSKQQPEPVSILASMPGRAHEKRLHRTFAKHKRRGEWFNPVSEILELAESWRKSAGTEAGIGRALDGHVDAPGTREVHAPDLRPTTTTTTDDDDRSGVVSVGGRKRMSPTWRPTDASRQSCAVAMIPDWALDVFVSQFVGNFVNKSEECTDADWNSRWVKWVHRGWNDSTRRPKKPRTDMPDEDAAMAARFT